MTIIAKFTGTCRKCGKTIYAGQECEWKRGVGIWHKDCCPEKKNLHRCIECGKIGEWAYDSEAGGYLCPRCEQLYI
ncbi:MAG: hypothetical protein ACTSPV_05205 [Candidatus Hodarchaeales archaeon]